MLPYVHYGASKAGLNAMTRYLCEPDEVAAAVLYLVSAEADFTTGEILHVHGGYLSH